MIPRKFLVLAVVGIVIGGSLVVYAAQSAITGDESTSQSKPSFVERLIPESGSEVLSQAVIGIDLAVEYDAELVINGTTISAEVDRIEGNGLHKVPEVGLIEFQPGPGKVVESLRKGERNNVIALVWKRSDGPANKVPVAWTFNVT